MCLLENAKHTLFRLHLKLTSPFLLGIFLLLVYAVQKMGNLRPNSGIYPSLRLKKPNHWKCVHDHHVLCGWTRYIAIILLTRLRHNAMGILRNWDFLFCTFSLALCHSKQDTIALVSLTYGETISFVLECRRGCHLEILLSQCSSFFYWKKNLQLIKFLHQSLDGVRLKKDNRFSLYMEYWSFCSVLYPMRSIFYNQSVQSNKNFNYKSFKSPKSTYQKYQENENTLNRKHIMKWGVQREVRYS